MVLVVSNLTIINKTFNEIELEWNIEFNYPEILFNVTWSDGTNNFSNTTNDTNIILEDLSSCTKYLISVKTICSNDNNNGDSIEEDSITVITFPENKSKYNY